MINSSISSDINWNMDKVIKRTRGDMAMGKISRTFFSLVGLGFRRHGYMTMFNASMKTMKVTTSQMMTSYGMSCVMKNLRI